MTTDPDWTARIECNIDDDPRLIPGAAMIVAHMARCAGFAQDVASELAAAAAAACDVAFGALRESGNSGATMRVAAAECPDRFEVTIEMPAAPDATYSHSAGRSVNLVGEIRQKLKNAVFDGTVVDLRDGIPRVTLVKNSGAAKRRFVC
jgi:hypothetical protein